MGFIASGAVTSATLRFDNSIGGNTVDESKFTSSSVSHAVGKCIIYDSSAGATWGAILYWDTAAKNFIPLVGSISTHTGTVPVSAAVITQASPMTTASGDSIQCSFDHVPITGWDTGALISTTEAALTPAKVDAVISTAAQTSNGNYQAIAWTESSDNSDSFDGTYFTAKKAMRVHGSGVVQFAANGSGQRVISYQINSSGTNILIAGSQPPSGSYAISFPFSFDVDLNAGDKVAIYGYQDATSSLNYGTSSHISFTEQPKLKDYTLYGAPFEIIDKVSSTKTPSGNYYHTMTDNSISLPAGTWRLNGTCYFANGGTSPGYTQAACRWASANGANSSTAPAGMSSVVTIVTGITEPLGYIALTTGVFSDNNVTAPETIVRCVSAPCTIYLDPFSAQSTAANARVTAVFHAERLQ
jgi:hypothetical protein